MLQLLEVGQHTSSIPVLVIQGLLILLCFLPFKVAGLELIIIHLSGFLDPKAIQILLFLLLIDIVYAPAYSHPPQRFTSHPPQCFTSRHPQCFTSRHPQCFTSHPPQCFTSCHPQCFTSHPSQCFTSRYPVLHLPPSTVLHHPPSTVLHLPPSTVLHLQGIPVIPAEQLQYIGGMCWVRHTVHHLPQALLDCWHTQLPLQPAGTVHQQLLQPVSMMSLVIFTGKVNCNKAKCEIGEATL
ncbi:hypothetical protein E2C01_029262 [Portunus trituberculatus]|uniref:Uncharacterized protein n=1 Tax=Portunus trituberculatus TaxID=210409 RepID=A0A5B7ER06_PORTR|nr:hypothetical protein [Portunus trituberculatus]